MLAMMMLRIMFPLPDRDPARARLRRDAGHALQPMPDDLSPPIVHRGKLQRSIAGAAG
jgi:hypothetical protein